MVHKIKKGVLLDGKHYVASGIIPTSTNDITLDFKVGKHHYSTTITRDEAKSLIYDNWLKTITENTIKKYPLAKNKWRESRFKKFYNSGYSVKEVCHIWLCEHKRKTYEKSNRHI